MSDFGNINEYKDAATIYLNDTSTQDSKYSILDNIIHSKFYDPNIEIAMTKKTIHCFMLDNSVTTIPIWYLIFINFKDSNIINYILNDERINIDLNNHIYAGLGLMAMTKENSIIENRIFKFLSTQYDHETVAIDYGSFPFWEIQKAVVNAVLDKNHPYHNRAIKVLYDYDILIIRVPSAPVDKNIEKVFEYMNENSTLDSLIDQIRIHGLMNELYPEDSYSENSYNEETPEFLEFA